MVKYNPEFTASRIKKARLGAHFTQKKMAELLGCSRQTVLGFESGVVIPRVNDIIAIAQLTGYSPSWFVTENAANLPESDCLRQLESAIANLAKAIENCTKYQN